MKKLNNYINTLQHLKKQSNHRELKQIPNDAINFSSNDYLGISKQEDLSEEFKTIVQSNSNEFLFGSCSSRLLSGNHQYYTELENLLVNAFRKEAAMVFGSGYHANIGILPALATSKDLIIADKLMHASLIDGIRLSRAKFERFRHNDMQHLEKLLKNNRSDYDNVFIVTESLFSMDGDFAPLQALIAIKEKYDAFLYIDEAHSFGVFGKNGLGYAEELNLIDKVDLLVGTFGKAIASQGAFLVCDEIIKDYLTNTARSLIFSTALPPISLAWTIFIINKLASLDKERSILKALYQYYSELTGFKPQSQIVSFMAGSNENAIRLSEQLKIKNIYALPIRYPTVPKGTERLRLSFHAALSKNDIDILVDELLNLNKLTSYEFKSSK